MDIHDITDVVQALNALKKTKLLDTQGFSFEFEASANPNHAIPYVARIVGVSSQLERTFFELESTYSASNVYVTGYFSANEGDILELCKGGNSVKKFQNIYTVYMGRLYYLGRTSSAKLRFLLKEYFNNTIDLATLQYEAKLI